MVLNGVSYSIPATGDQNWSGSGGVDGYLIALATGVFTKAGGAFTLTNEADFGGSFGLKAIYLKSRTSNSASSGQIRLGNTDSVTWRNAANSADLTLSVPASNHLQFNSIDLADLSSSQTLTNKTISGSANTLSNIAYASLVLTGSIVNADISSGAAIAYSKLNLATSIVNADINASAGIAYSKLNLATSILNADINASAAIAYSKLALTGTILNADLSASAAIAFTKLAALTSANILVGNVSNVATAVAVTGDVSLSNAGVTAYSGTVPLNKGGTGQTTKAPAFDALQPMSASGDLIYGGASGTGTRLPKGSDGQYLKQIAGMPSWAASTGGGGGSKNYLAVVTTSNGTNTGNGDFELNATTGFSLAHSALTNNFPSTLATATNSFSSAGGAHGGSAANGNLAQSIVSSSQLAGAYSYSYASSAATTAGDMVITDAFNIDTEDQAKVLTFKIYYKGQTNASNANWSGTSSNSFGIAVYDVTNAAWIMPTGVWGMTQSSGVGLVTGTFQTTSNSTQYQLAMFNANATSGAATLYLDDWSVGPQTAPLGAVITDWVAYTPIFVGFTPTNIAIESRRVGGSLEIRGNVTVASNVASTVSMTLGFNGTNGNVTSSSVIGSAGAANELVGFWASSSSSSALTQTAIIAPSSNLLLMGVISGTQSGLTAVLANAGGATSGTESVHAVIPITGWSSNVQMSSDMDTRVVAMQVNQASPTATITSSYSNVKWTSTPISDTHAGYSTSTGKYTCPVTGYYRVTAALNVVATYTAGQGVNLAVFKTGSEYQEWDTITPAITASTVVGFVTCTVLCNAGETLEIQAKTSGTSVSIGANAFTNYFNVERLSGPSVIAATESVNMRYTTITSTTIPTSFAVMPFNVLVKDTHNAYNTTTGLYTCPVSGMYSVKAVIGTAALTLTTAQGFQMAVYKNGSIYSNLAQTFGAGGGGQGYVISGGDDIPCNAGDTMAIYATAGAVGGLSINAGVNHLSIVRVGN